MPASITLYRFLAAEWALRTLRERRLRASRIIELNDPFEWRIGTIAETLEQAEAGRVSFDAFVKRINDQWGIISMSAVHSDPVIWSHYADSHKGIALEFDHERDTGLHAIAYSHALPMFDVTRFLREGLTSEYTLGVIRTALGRKSITWSYEREYRAHLDLTKCDEDGGHYFSSIPDDFLKRVILGIRCDTPTAEVEQALEASGFHGVPVVRARMSETAYEILCD
jgi:hypothetical protein